MAESSARLASELSVDDVLGAQGIIREQITDFSARDSQLAMARLIADCIASGDHRMIEASTGIGKSFACLVPVFLSNKKVVISTGTKRTGLHRIETAHAVIIRSEPISTNSRRHAA